MTDAEPIDHEPWPLRAALLLALGAAAGLLCHLLTKATEPWAWTDSPLRIAAATFVGVGAIVFAFSLERLRWTWSAAFAAAGGLIVALVGYWNGSPGNWGAGEGWQFAAAIVAVAIAVPLFQAARDEGARKFPVRHVHSHAWSNIILWGAAWAFVGASFILTVVLSELFSLIGIEVLRDLLRDGWFGWVLAGAAFGGAVGLLRDRDAILTLLQRVVRAIASVLAPFLALGLVLFVLALPFTGLEPLWSKTRETTPILLVCVLGAVVLANAVIGNGSDEEAKAPPLRWAALGLAGVILPLAAVAAVSTGKRVAQYGYTPDRLWAAVFVASAASFGIAYLLSIFMARSGWAGALRRANVRLAMGLCLLALFLALPIVSFGAISARDQIARLETGKVKPEEFDWAAMRFDFGPAGRRALEQLASSGPAPLRAQAATWLKANDRWAMTESTTAAPMRPEPSQPRLRVEPEGRTAPRPLVEAISRTGQCGAEPCRLVLLGERQAVLVSRPCDTCPPQIHLAQARPDGSWEATGPEAPQRTARSAEDAKAAANAFRSGRVEVRTVERRQVYVDGQPAGPVFD